MVIVEAWMTRTSPVMTVHAAAPSVGFAAKPNKGRMTSGAGLGIMPALCCGVLDMSALSSDRRVLVRARIESE